MGGGGGGLLGKLTSTLFGKQTIAPVPEPEPEPLPKPPGLPEKVEPEVEAAKKKERKVSRLRSGRQSTILSNLRRELSPTRQPGGDQLG